LPPPAPANNWRTFLQDPPLMSCPRNRRCDCTDALRHNNWTPILRSSFSLARQPS
jgi:hypothetical protein